MAEQIETAEAEKNEVRSRRDILRSHFERVDSELAQAEQRAERELNELLNIPKPEPAWLTPDEEKELTRITKEFEARRVKVEGLCDDMEAIIREMRGMLERSQQLTYEKRHKSTSIDTVRFSAWVNRILPARVGAIYNRVIVGLRN